MAYTDINFPTKKAMVSAFIDGKTLTVYQPGPFGPRVADGWTSIEGPHYPKPHRWYARVRVEDGRIVEIAKR